MTGLSQQRRTGKPSSRNPARSATSRQSCSARQPDANAPRGATVATSCPIVDREGAGSRKATGRHARPPTRSRSRSCGRPPDKEKPDPSLAPDHLVILPMGEADHLAIECIQLVVEAPALRPSASPSRISSNGMTPMPSEAVAARPSVRPADEAAGAACAAPSRATRRARSRSAGRVRARSPATRSRPPASPGREARRPSAPALHHRQNEQHRHETRAAAASAETNATIRGSPLHRPALRDEASGSVERRCP